MAFYLRFMGLAILNEAIPVIYKRIYYIWAPLILTVQHIRYYE